MIEKRSRAQRRVTDGSRVLPVVMVRAPYAPDPVFTSAKLCVASFVPRKTRSSARRHDPDRRDQRTGERLIRDHEHALDERRG